MTYSICKATDMRSAPWTSVTARPARSVPVSPSASAGPIAANDQTALRERLRVGRIALDRRSFPRRQSLTAKVTASSVQIVIPMEGRVAIVTDGDMLTVEPGQIGLLGRPQDAVLVWSAGASGDLLALRRDQLQICASSHFGAPRRLAAVARTLEMDEPFVDALAALKACADSTAVTDVAASDIESEFHLALIRLTTRQNLAPELFLDVRSAREAIDYIRANYHQDCSPATLAAISGVTERTLRERFRQCLGVSIVAFVQDVRLDWAHARLASARECRSIGDLALATGFATAGGFSKSYQRRFGEPATHTRMRAVRDAGAA